MADKKPSASALNGDLSLNLLPILKRRLGLLASSAVLGLIAAAGYFWLTPSKYVSQAEILLMQNSPASINSHGMDSSGADVSEELLATHMKIIQSKKLIRDALENNGLMELPSIVELLGDSGSAVNYVRDNLFVTSGGKGEARDAHVLNVSFHHYSAEDCQVVAQAVVDQYQAYVTEKFKDSNAKAVALIDKLRGELESEIEELDTSYTEFRLNSPLLSSGGGDIYTARYEELATEAGALALQIDEAEGRLSLVKQSLERISEHEGVHGLEKLSLIDEQNAARLGILVNVERGKAETAAFQATQPERVAGAQTEYSFLLQKRSRLKQLLNDYGPKHPEARELQDQVAEMEAFLDERSAALGIVEEETQLTPDDIMSAYVSMLENDLLALRQQRASIDIQMAATEKEAKALIELEMENDELLRERARSEDVYSATVERLRNLNLQADSVALIQELLETPERGERIQPNLPIALAVFLLTALTLGGGSTILAELSDRCIHEPDELEKIFSSTIVGHVPNFENDRHVRDALQEAKRSKSRLDPHLLTFHAPASRASEGFRAIRTQALFTLGGKNKIISVTSATEGAGKSTMISNLSVSLASSGQQVLLIDCDMRKPRIASIFGVDGSRGLTDVLERGSDPTDVIQAGPVNGLFIMATGQLPENPAEVLAGQQFSSLLDALREKYDYVILDCPPVLPVADPTIIAPLTDGIIFVSTIDHESKPQSERASKILSGVDAKVIGIIVNRVDEATSRYGYSGYGYESIGSVPYYSASVAK